MVWTVTKIENRKENNLNINLTNIVVTTKHFVTLFFSDRETISLFMAFHSPATIE